MTKPQWSDRSSDDADIDAEFAAIVAGWNKEAPATGNRTGSSGTPPVVKPGTEPNRLGAPILPPARPEPRRPVFDVAPPAWRVHLVPEEVEEEDGFTEPDPPLPRGDLRFWGAVIGLTVGPIVFMGWALTGPHTTHLPLALSGLGTVAGFALLVTRPSPDEDNGDDGARV